MCFRKHEMESGLPANLTACFSINLSSVRGPRTNEASEAPFKDEAKEFLRKKLIGKHVRVSIDGSKPASDDFEARDVATVTQNGKNVGLMLVQEGYCSVIRHRKDDTDRAPNYDELLAAQEPAKEEKKGMWSGKPPKVCAYTIANPPFYLPSSPPSGGYSRQF